MRSMKRERYEGETLGESIITDIIHVCTSYWIFFTVGLGIQV